VDTSYQDHAKEEAERARKQEEERQARIRDGMGHIENAFGDMQPTLDNRAQHQRDYYLPQLDEQYGDAKEDLGFALHRAGLSTSTVAGEKQADLSNKFALKRGEIESDIESDIANTKGRINQSKQQLQSTLRNTGDATAAQNNALQSAVTFREEMPTLGQLGDVFAGLASGIGSSVSGYRTGDIYRKSQYKPKNHANDLARVVGA
jgi:F0F1-type ATP synthase membrane subunit b/b'